MSHDRKQLSERYPERAGWEIALQGGAEKTGPAGECLQLEEEKR